MASSRSGSRSRRGRPSGASGHAGQGGSPPLGAEYEGLEALTELLARAGSPHDAGEVVTRFLAAQASGQARADVVPALFPGEPRFASPDEARRLYGNLLGLWDRLEAGLGPAADEPGAERPEPEVPEPPPRGSLGGHVLPADFVESAWRWLGALTERESRRLRDRHGNAQPDLVAWLDESDLPAAGELAARDLAFEAWAMMDLAFGDRLEALEWKDLRALALEPPPLEETQPSLAAYVAEQLDNLEDEDRELGAAGRAQVERALAAVGAALTRAVAEDG